MTEKAVKKKTAIVNWIPNKISGKPLPKAKTPKKEPDK